MAAELVLCDTNILIEFYKGNPKIIGVLRKLSTENLCISVISQAELYYGALNRRELLQIKENLSYFRIFQISETISEIFLNLMDAFSLSHKINIPDTLIASTAIFHHLPLYTINKKDFKFIPEIVLYQ